jgi:hypothetical protein
MEFNQDTADHICEEIGNGKSLRTICAGKNMPSRTTVNKWLREVESFAHQYARAHEEQGDYYAEELMELAAKANAENAQAIRVKADIIKWVCSKLKPRKYGDRVGLEVKGEMHSTVTVDDKDSMEVARRIAFILSKAATQKAKEIPRLPAPPMTIDSAEVF